MPEDLGAKEQTLRACFSAAAARVRAISSTPELDARLLMRAAFGLTHEGLIAGANEPAGSAEMKRLDELIARRLRGEPVSRILGRREFYGRDFVIDGTTLDPRGETEVLADVALEALEGSQGNARIADLGTGTGCILVTVLAEKKGMWGVGIDRSAAALRIARANAEAHGVASRAAFVCCDWLEAASGPFDAIVANPPYIPSGQIAALCNEVRDHDPRLALDGGPDGLAAFRLILFRAAGVLRPGGTIIFEVGAGQADAVQSLMSQAGFGSDPALRNQRDLAGIMRCVVAKNKPH